ALDIGARKFDAAKLLSEHGAVTGFPPLLDAVNRGDLPRVQELLASGADPNARDMEGGPALQIAAGNGDLAIAKALVASHALIDGPPNNKVVTPLMVAAGAGHTEMV